MNAIKGKQLCGVPNTVQSVLGTSSCGYAATSLRRAGNVTDEGIALERRETGGERQEVDFKVTK